MPYAPCSPPASSTRFFFVLFIQRMAPLLGRRKHALQASDACRRGRLPESLCAGRQRHLGREPRRPLHVLGGQLFGFDPSTSAGNATALAVAKFMVLTRSAKGRCTVGDGLRSGRAALALALVDALRSSPPSSAASPCGASRTAARLDALVLAVRSAPRSRCASWARARRQTVARLSFHLGAVAFGVLATAACCFVFSGAVLALCWEARNSAARRGARRRHPRRVGALRAAAHCAAAPWLLGKLPPPPQHAYPVGEEKRLAEAEAAAARQLGALPLADRADAARAAAARHRGGRAARPARPSASRCALLRLARVRLHLVRAAPPLRAEPRTIFLCNHRGWADSHRLRAHLGRDLPRQVRDRRRAPVLSAPRAAPAAAAAAPERAGRGPRSLAPPPTPAPPAPLCSGGPLRQADRRRLLLWREEGAGPRRARALARGALGDAPRRLGRLPRGPPQPGLRAAPPQDRRPRRRARLGGATPTDAPTDA